MIKVEVVKVFSVDRVQYSSDTGWSLIKDTFLLEAAPGDWIVSHNPYRPPFNKNNLERWQPDGILIANSEPQYDRCVPGNLELLLHRRVMVLWFR